MKTTIASLSREITTEAEAYAYLEGLRWKGAPTCAHCKGSDVYLIVPKNGTSRKTRTGSMSERRVWRCRECNRQFSVLTGTIMHRTKIPVRVWVLVYFDFMAAKNGMSAREVERKYGLCPRSAWFLMHRIREAMCWDGDPKFANTTVLADETYLGGNPKNRHKSVRGTYTGGYPAITGRGTKKTPIVSVINAQTGETRSRVVASIDGGTLWNVIMGTTDPAGSVLVTDEWKSYKMVSTMFAKHETVNHSKDEYVRDGYTTNPVEAFFAQLKRSIDGTHHRVSEEHLHRYVTEHDFRRSTHKMADADRMGKLLTQVEGRVTYKRIKTS